MLNIQGPKIGGGIHGPGIGVGIPSVSGSLAINSNVSVSAPLANIKRPSVKVNRKGIFCTISSAFPGTLTKVDVDLGQGKESSGVRIGKDEPKIQKKNFISQDVNTNIHPIINIPKIKVFKEFLKKKEINYITLL